MSAQSYLSCTARALQTPLRHFLLPIHLCSCGCILRSVKVLGHAGAGQAAAVPGCPNSWAEQDWLRSVDFWQPGAQRPDGLGGEAGRFRGSGWEAQRPDGLGSEAAKR